jgi:hypothetical protein
LDSGEALFGGGDGVGADGDGECADNDGRDVECVHLSPCLSSKRMNKFHRMSDPQQVGQGLVMRHHAVGSVVSLLQCRQVNLFMVFPCLRVG